MKCEMQCRMGRILSVITLMFLVSLLISSPSYAQSANEETLLVSVVTVLDTNPSVSDIDLDGKPDECETLDPILLRMPGSTYTHMLLPDSDGDGLLDGQEDPGDCDITTGTLALTNPRDRDTDGNGIWDGVEVLLLGSDPLDPLDPNPSSSDAIDADGDGLPASIDPDDNNPDSDGDGFLDGYEVIYGADPLDADSYPALGDVNGDMRSNNVDAILIFNYMLGNVASMPRPENADVDINGVINNVDGIVLFNWNLRNIPHLPFLY